MLRDKFLAGLINRSTLLVHFVLEWIISEEVLLEYKPLHWCGWFIKRGLIVPKYFISSSSAPTVTDSAATSVTKISATGNGNITSNGGATITANGFVISQTSVNSNPLLAGTGVTNVTATTVQSGAFTASMASLTPNTGYSYKAYATNSKGTGYGTVQTFTTNGLDTVALNSPADTATGVSTTPALQFTGTDSDSLDITYEVQVDTVNTFDSQGASSIAFVKNGGTNGDGSNTNTSMNLTVPAGGHASGNLLIISVLLFANSTSESLDITDSRGNSYTLIKQQVSSGNGFIFDVLFASVLGTTLQAGDTITISSHTSNNFFSISATSAEFSGASITQDVALASTFPSGSTTTPSVGPITPPDAVTLVIGNTSITAGPSSDSFTEDSDSNGGDSWHSGPVGSATSGNLSTARLAYKITTSSAAQTYNPTLGTARGVGNIIASFKKASSPLIDATSASGGHDAAQFSGTPDNTDPYASGQAVTFTVPAGETLTASTTYYWRVRGKDPSGSNTYGAWATTRSFTTASASSGAVLPIRIMNQAVKQASEW